VRNATEKYLSKVWETEIPQKLSVRDVKSISASLPIWDKSVGGRDEECSVAIAIEP